MAAIQNNQPSGPTTHTLPQTDWESDGVEGASSSVEEPPEAWRPDPSSEGVVTTEESADHGVVNPDGPIEAKLMFDAERNVALRQVRAESQIPDASSLPVLTAQSLDGFEPAARDAEAERIRPRVVRVQHGGITIDVRELNEFKNGVQHSEIPGLLRRATEEKAREDTVAYGESIARYIHKNGDAAFDRAVSVYNRDYGTNLSPDIAPTPRRGRFRDRAMLAERTKLVQSVLDDNPHLTSRVIREMAKDEGYFGSDAHVAWSKAAEARTAGKIPAEWWRTFDPYGGTAGNGPNIEITGRHPGTFSRIAMAHDTDWSIGRHFGFGPLAKLRGAEGFTPEQLGWVGLRPDHPFGYFAGVDVYTFGHRDWNVKY